VALTGVLSFDRFISLVDQPPSSTARLEWNIAAHAINESLDDLGLSPVVGYVGPD
jgi:hypothetical protein